MGCNIPINTDTRSVKLWRGRNGVYNTVTATTNGVVSSISDNMDGTYTLEIPESITLDIGDLLIISVLFNGRKTSTYYAFVEQTLNSRIRDELSDDIQEIKELSNITADNTQRV